jgi:hypothetical protein
MTKSKIIKIVVCSNSSKEDWALMYIPDRLIKKYNIPSTLFLDTGEIKK